MTAYLIPGLMGLLIGLMLHWGGFSRAAGLRAAMGLRRSLALRTGLTALGWGVLLTALLMWLAVIDVDTVMVLPLSLGALLGGVLFGVCAGMGGFTPATAFAGLGAGNALEALCVLGGCAVMTWLTPALDRFLRPLQAPWAYATLFKVTLDEPYLFDGAFLGLGGLGALLVVWGMCAPSPRVVIIPDEAIAARAAEIPLPSAEPAPEESAEAPEPEAAVQEAVVLALEGEEPLVVDTALDEAGETEGTDESVREG